MSREDALALRTLIGGAWVTQAIAVAAKIKVADFVCDSPTSINELAKKTRTKPELLYRVLRALASEGIFQEHESGTFSHTILSKLLVSNTPNSLRHVAMFYGDQTYLAFDEFENQLRTGEKAYEKVFGKDIFANIQNDPERSDVFNRAMLEISYEQTGAILDALDFSSISTLCDIGGGKGHLLANILKKFPHMKGILFDQSHVIPAARSYLQEQQLMDRCQCISGSFFEPISIQCDAAIMKYIVHDWPDEKAISILHNVKKITKRIWVVEQMIPQGNEPLYGKLSDLMMMTSFGSGERTQQEFEKLFNQAGLKIQKIYPTDYLLYVFELS